MCTLKEGNFCADFHAKYGAHQEPKMVITQSQLSSMDNLLQGIEFQRPMTENEIVTEKV